MTVDVSMYQAQPQNNDLQRLLLGSRFSDNGLGYGNGAGTNPLLSLLAAPTAAATGGAAPVSAGGQGNLGGINSPYTSSMETPNAFYGYLRKQGATHNEALMLTGAAASESGFDHTTAHDNGAGYGLFGHNTGRLDMRGMGWQDQAAAALKELRGRPEGKAVNNAKTSADLTNAQMDYERPAGWRPGSPQTGHNYTGRLNTIDRFQSIFGAPGPQADASQEAN